MSDKQESDHFRFLTYVVGDKSRPQALYQSYNLEKPVRVFRSSNGDREKGDFFPQSPKDGKTVYRYDGLYFIIYAFDRHGKRVDRTNDKEQQAKVFYMVRGEPETRMEELFQQFGSFRCCIDQQNAIPSSKLASELLIDGLDPFDIDDFHDWCPCSSAV